MLITVPEPPPEVPTVSVASVESVLTPIATPSVVAAVELPGTVRSRRRCGDVHQPIRIRIRKRIQENGVHNAEHSGGDANGEAERHHRHHGETGRTPQSTACMCQILRPTLDHSSHASCLPLSNRVCRRLHHRWIPMLCKAGSGEIQ